jgi:hypothetical protein
MRLNSVLIINARPVPVFEFMINFSNKLGKYLDIPLPLSYIAMDIPDFS